MSIDSHNDGDTPRDARPLAAVAETSSGPVTIRSELGADNEDDLWAGCMAGDYMIERLLGKGGAGTVYLATRQSDRQRAAVKVLKRSLASTRIGVERFLREVETVHRIKHANIIDIFDLGRLADNRPYYAMELLDGENLRGRLAIDGRLSPLESLEIVEPICAGLAMAHNAGIVHRDLKLDNVMVTRDRRVKLVDFGIAKLLEPEPGVPGLTTTGQFLGTPSAMSPEQIRGEQIDRRTDIYALGVLVYNLLTGTSPFRGDWEEVTRAHLVTPPRPPSALVPLPPAVDAAVLGCLEKDPAVRFQSVDAFLRVYRQAVLGEAAPTLGQIGIGVLVRANAVDEADTDALAEATMALDNAEVTLRAAGLQIAVQTTTEVMGVMLAPVQADEELRVRRSVIAVANALHEELRSVLPAGVRVCVGVHTDQIEVQAETGAIVGGQLLELEHWGPALPGVSLTLAVGSHVPG